MSAGTGVTHSEQNASRTEPVHFLQIWLVPSQRGLPPGYEQKAFSPAEKQGKFRLVASPDGSDGSITIHADARLPWNDSLALSLCAWRCIGRFAGDPR